MFDELFAYLSDYFKYPVFMREHMGTMALIAYRKIPQPLQIPVSSTSVWHIRATWGDLSAIERASEKSFQDPELNRRAFDALSRMQMNQKGA